MIRNSTKSTFTGVFTKYLKSSRGNATMLTTLAAIPMVATAGMAIDYMRAVRSKTDLQQAVDAAALAAASAKNVTGTTTQQLAQRKAIATSYITKSVANVSDIELIGTPTVTTGPNTIDVSVSAKVKGSLINVLNALPTDALTGEGGGGSVAGSNKYDTTLNVHSKVGFSSNSYLCLLALNPTLTYAINFEGNATFYASCAVQANSTATIAMRAWGSSEAYATSFCSLGGWVGSGFEPDPKGGCSTKADPYAGLTLPTAGSCITAATIPQATVHATQGVTVKNTTAALKPGTYCKGLHVTTHGVANLEKGLYIIKDGTLDIDANSTVNAQTGVVFYLAGANAYLDVKSGAVLKVTAPTTATAISSTTAYKGMAIMQERVTGTANTLYSKGGVNIDGAFYSPKRKLIVWANDTMNANSKYFPIVVDNFNMSGTSTLYVNLDYAGAGYAEPTELKQTGKVFVSQ